MLELWNDSSILPPPVHTTMGDSDIDVKELKHTCKNVIRILSKQSPLHKEGAIISRLLYKFDKKFRNDLGYRNLRKVYTALRKYLVLDFMKVIENFTSTLPGVDDKYLPTRQLLEYVLVRLITFVKIMIRIFVCSKQASIFYLDRIKRGESHWMSLMPYASLSRIWSMSKVLIQHSSTWYSCLYKYVDKLHLKGLNFLPENYELPNDLDEWLDLKNLDEIGRLEWSQKKQLKIDLSFDEDDKFDNIINYVHLINTEEEQQETNIEPASVKLKVIEQLQVTPIRKVDQGESISRESYILHNFQKKMKNLDSHHYFERVTNLTSLQEFIEKEETLRNEGNNQSLTTHLSLMQWHALKNTLLKLCDPLSNNRKIERKFQKIWKEKCLEYI